MDRNLLAHLPVVVTVARQKGFAAAAAVLNMSASAVSHAVKALEDIGAAVESLTAARGAVTGTLRINAPHTAFPMGLSRVIAKLAWEQPRLIVEVHTNEAFVDIVAQGYDAGIRLGEA